MHNVMIKILSSIETGGDVENIEFATTGRMLVKDGICRIYYDGDDGSGSSSGVIKTEGNRVVIKRSGESSSQLSVRTGERCVGHYDMGPMGMMVGVTGRQVVVSFTENSADISIEYAIDINAAPVSVNKVVITATPA